MSRPLRRILLLPIGSSGDVNPFLWIGGILRQRGHEVSMIANPVFAPEITARGLRHIPFGDVEEYHSLLDHPDVWHPVKGPPLVMRYAGEVTARHHELIEPEVITDRPLVIAPLTAFGARLARQRISFPLVTVHLQPCVLLSSNDTPLFAQHLAWLQHLPEPLKRLLFTYVYAKLDRLVDPGVNHACRHKNIPPPRKVFREWWQSPDGGLCLWPEWFAAPQRDWPHGLTCTGFPLYDLADKVSLAPELDRFLAAGSPPVLFTPGTAMAQGAEFFRTALKTCQQTGRRAIFATKFPDQLPERLPEEICHVLYAPFSSLLPRCAGIVHHGGIGTTSQALAAGCPQLIRPFSHDQPDNASRVRRLGAGRILWSREFTPSRLSNELDALLGDLLIRERCRELARRLTSQNAEQAVLAALTPHLIQP